MVEGGWCLEVTDGRRGLMFGGVKGKFYFLIVILKKIVDKL